MTLNIKMLSKTSVISLVLIILFIHYLIFVRDKKYYLIISEFKKRKIDGERKKKIIVPIYIVGSFLIGLLSSYLLGILT